MSVTAWVLVLVAIGAAVVVGWVYVYVRFVRDQL